LPDAQTPPRAKRAVPTARAVAAEAPAPAAVRAPKGTRAAVRVPDPAPVAKRHPVELSDPVPARRPGFRVSPPAPVVDDDVEEPGTNYALRLTEALDAISSAQNPVAHPRPAATHRQPEPTAPDSPGAAHRNAHAQATPPLPLGEAARSAGEGDASARKPPSRTKPSPPPSPRGSGSSALSSLGERFANLPPIRLPIGPPIPWRFGLPGLVVLVAVMIFVARPISQADSQISRLPIVPTPDTYPVQQEAPLFTDAQPTPAAAPLGVPDAGGVGFDVLDVGLKLVAVLALAYGSLLLLKRAGMGGAAAVKISARGSGMQVVASLTLAPNRTVHLLKVPGGKTVLVGATPTQVNLIVDLGELPEDPESAAAGSFFDILKGKL